jgi:quercetin dioxygenase-like cupin family protein
MPLFNFNELNEKEMFPGFKARVIHGESMTIAYMRVTEGAEAPEHSHPHEQITHVVEGKLELTIDGVPQTFSAGEVAVIPSNVRHSARGVTDCLVLDVFHPVREDYK